MSDKKRRAFPPPGLEEVKRSFLERPLSGEETAQFLDDLTDRILDLAFLSVRSEPNRAEFMQWHGMFKAYEEILSGMEAILRRRKL
jgi:hypothetical protein